MIFTEDHARQVLYRMKWQTRRIAKPGDFALVRGPGKMVWHWHPDWGPRCGPSGAPLEPGVVIFEVRDVNGRLKWKVGNIYAVQTGRGKRAIGKTTPIEAIRWERLQEITMEDAFAEGVPKSEGVWAVNWFAELWDRIYRKAAYRYQGFRWRDDPEVWVLIFERAKGR